MLEKCQRQFEEMELDGQTSNVPIKPKERERKKHLESKDSEEKVVDVYQLPPIADFPNRVVDDQPEIKEKIKDFINQQ